MKNNNDNNNKVNRKIKQINKAKSFKKSISKYVPLSSVTIDIVSQHYKKRAQIKHQNRATSRSFNPFGWKVSSSCCQKDSLFLSSSTLSVWSINLTSQSSSPLWLTSAK